MIYFFLQRLSELFKSSKGYRLVATLIGHEAPVNCFAFTRNGNYLASGGDDQTVRLWETNTFSEVQVLRDTNNRWGQITCVDFLNVDVITMASQWLCFGTARGLLLIYRRNRRGNEFVELSNTRVFPASDSIESFAYDTNHQRIIMTSHFGQIKMYNFNGGNPTDMWSDEMKEAIPRAVFFSDRGNQVMIYGLETGIVLCRESDTSAEKSSRVLKSVIGNVSLCPQEKNILIDNMTNGFDLYSAARTSPLRSFCIETSKKYVKKGVFGEKGGIVICGSDHGKVYIFSTNKGEPLQTLKHDGKGGLIQVVEAATLIDCHLIASGSSEGRCEICIWQKQARQGIKERKTGHQMLKTLLLIFGLIIVLLLALLVSPDVQTATGIEWVKSASMRALERVQTPIDGINDNRKGPRVKADLDVENLLEMNDDAFRRVLKIKGLRLTKGDKDNEDDEDDNASLDML